jgi:hypothetical protein
MKSESESFELNRSSDNAEEENANVDVIDDVA